MLPITASEVGSGLVPPAVATHLLGDLGFALILTMLFMAIVSTGSAESVAVSSLVSYYPYIYREYFDPEATGAHILFVSRIAIVVVFLWELFQSFWTSWVLTLMGIPLDGNCYWICCNSSLEYDALEKGLWNRSCYLCMGWTCPRCYWMDDWMDAKSSLDPSLLPTLERTRSCSVVSGSLPCLWRIRSVSIPRALSLVGLLGSCTSGTIVVLVFVAFFPFTAVAFPADCAFSIQTL